MRNITGQLYTAQRHFDIVSLQLDIPDSWSEPPAAVIGVAGGESNNSNDAINTTAVDITMCREKTKPG